MTVHLRNLAIGGYRSFGRVQYFERFAKLNILIGQNNCGKSNVLRFIRDILSTRRTAPDDLAFHMPDRPPMLVGSSEPFEVVSGQPLIPTEHRILAGLEPAQRQHRAPAVAFILNEKAKAEGMRECWTLRGVQDQDLIPDGWFDAMRLVPDEEMHTLFAHFRNARGGSRKKDWEPVILDRLASRPPELDVVLIPAIRQIGKTGSKSVEFDGLDIVDQLVKLQNPGVFEQAARNRFNGINAFVREVSDRPEATIEIPHDRGTILVHMDGKVLPIEALGSGLHEVVILAAAATVHEGKVLCIEEPELHLNPILQKKLVRYLQRHTSNQYFITTHSAALMDTPEAEVYHLRLGTSGSVVERVTTDRHRSDVCADLGYHPSDLLQANCIVWVEGPSDRLYLAWWLREVAPELVEGVHFSVMFYGGRLAAHVSAAEDDEAVQGFISLRRLNRRGVMVIDSDKKSSHTPLNETKKRLKDEFNSGPGHAWVTAGREIENYIPEGDLRAAIASVHPSASVLGAFGRFDSTLKIRTKSGKELLASKVDVAHHVVSHSKPDLQRHDLRDQLLRLRDFIWTANPKMATG